MGNSGLSDIFTAGFEAVTAPAPTATGGLWDWVKGQAAGAWDFAKDLGARVITTQVMPSIPPAPMPAPKPPLIVAGPAPGTPPIFDWQIGSGQSPAVPAPTAVGGIPITLLLVGGAALLLMAKGKGE